MAVLFPSLRTDAGPIAGRIISSGRLERYKGHHRIIEALPQIIREVPEAHLVILGAGPYESELLNIARKRGVIDRVSVQLIPPDNRQAMADKLAEASVVVALSDYEAHPVGVMEALSLRRPVIGYKTSGIAELVDEGWVHGIDPAASPSALAAQLVQGMSIPPAADPAELPTWDTCAEQLRQVYLTLGDRGHDAVSRSTAAAGRSLAHQQRSSSSA